MELNITHLLNEELTDYSASRAQLGDNAADITWNNSKEAVSKGRVSFVVTPSEIEDAKDYFKDFGAWSKKEIEGWTPIELNALILQMVAGDLKSYLSAKEEGPKRFEQYLDNEGGRIIEEDNGEFYYYLGR